MRAIDADALERALGYLWVVTTQRDTDDKETSLERAAMCRGIDVCIGIVQRAPTIGGWISVKDRLPEERVWVLAWASEGFAYTDQLISGVWWVGANNGAIITHWQPLPEPPEEGDAGE